MQITSKIEWNINTQEEIIKRIPSYDGYIKALFKNMPDRKIYLMTDLMGPIGVAIKMDDYVAYYYFTGQYHFEPVLRFQRTENGIPQKVQEYSVKNADEVLSLLGYTKITPHLSHLMDKIF